MHGSQNVIFDLMSGTSTGGTVPAGLHKKDNQGNPQYSANDLIDLFESSFFRTFILLTLEVEHTSRYKHIKGRYVGSSNID